MNHRVLFLFFALSAVSYAAPPPELTVLRQQFDKILAERVTAPFDAGLAELNTKFTTALDNAATSAKKTGRLDDVLAIQDDQKRLAEKLPIPDDIETTPALLKPLRAIYREQLQKLTDARTANHSALLPAYTAKLQALEVTLTQADRIDEAKELRSYREGLTLGGAAGLPAAASVPTKAIGEPSALPVPTNTPKVKGDDRKAAEWLVKVGAHFEIDEKGKKSKPTKPEDLPKGKFTILTIALDGRDTKQAITADGLANLQGLEGVISFASGQLPLTDADVSFLATLPALEFVAFSRDSKITDAVIAHLTGLKSLKRLHVVDVWAFTGVELHQLAGIRTLTDVQFTSVGINAAGAESLAKLKELRFIILENCKRFDDAALLHLGKLPKLTRLQMPGTACTAEGLAAAKLKIEHLDFNKLSEKLPGETASIVGPAYPEVVSLRLAMSEPFKRGDIAALAHFKSLRSINILAVNDTSAWAGLASIPTLESITLDRNPFSDAEVDHLLQVPSLVGITFMNVDVTDAGILKLVSLKKLKRLGLKPCPKVTDAGIAALKKQRPDIQISR